MEPKTTPEQGQERMAGKENQWFLFISQGHWENSQKGHTHTSSHTTAKPSVGEKTPCSKTPSLPLWATTAFPAQGKACRHNCIRPRHRGAVLTHKQWETRQPLHWAACLGCFCWLLPLPFPAVFYSFICTPLCLGLIAGSQSVSAQLRKMGVWASRSPPCPVIGTQRFCNALPSCDMYQKPVLCQQSSVCGTAGKSRCCMDTSAVSHSYFRAWADKSQAPGQHTPIQTLGLSFASEQMRARKPWKQEFSSCHKSFSFKYPVRDREGRKTIIL